MEGAYEQIIKLCYKKHAVFGWKVMCRGLGKSSILKKNFFFQIACDSLVRDLGNILF